MIEREHHDVIVVFVIQRAGHVVPKAALLLEGRGAETENIFGVFRVSRREVEAVVSFALYDPVEINLIRRNVADDIERPVNADLDVSFVDRALFDDRLAKLVENRLAFFVYLGNILHAVSVAACGVPSDGEPALAEDKRALDNFDRLVLDVLVVEVEVDKPLGKLSLSECGLVVVHRARREGRSASGRHGEQVLGEVAVGVDRKLSELALVASIRHGRRVAPAALGVEAVIRSNASPEDVNPPARAERLVILCCLLRNSSRELLLIARCPIFIFSHVYVS